MRLSPVLEGMTTYPFVRLTEASARPTARGVDVIDFGIGEPREETPAFIRRALARALEAEPVSTYPPPPGCPSCARRSPAGSQRRFGAALDPDTEVVPTLGSKEAIFHLAQVVAGRGARVASRPRAIPCRPAARCSPAPRSSTCRSIPRAAGCPTSTPSTGTASRCCG